jgi:hypothetical protein
MLVVISSTARCVHDVGIKWGVTADVGGVGGEVCWVVTLSRRASGQAFQDAIFLDCFTLKTIQPFETSGSTHPMTQCHIPEDWKRQKHRCENLKCGMCTCYWCVRLYCCVIANVSRDVQLLPSCYCYELSNCWLLVKVDRSQRRLPTAVADTKLICVDLTSLRSWTIHVLCIPRLIINFTEILFTKLLFWHYDLQQISWFEGVFCSSVLLIFMSSEFCVEWVVLAARKTGNRNVTTLVTVNAAVTWLH